MNKAAANALYEAERKGVKQIKWQLHDTEGGRCASGVLADALLGTTSVQTRWSELIGLAGMTSDEWSRMVVLNNIDSLTFSEIARKLGPDSA